MESEIVEAATSAEERGMVCLWQAVTEQIADLEATRALVLMARRAPRCRKDVHEASQMIEPR